MGNKDSVVAKLHQKRFALEKRKGSSPENLDNFVLLKHSRQLQARLYESANYARMEMFFANGGCFGPELQRRMVKGNNLKVLNMFLARWEFVPNERRFMIRNASLSFIRLYVREKPLGKQSVELVKNRRFPTEFIQEIMPYLNTEAQRLAKIYRKIN